ncbi:hypothetical protein [Georgenia wangjunii]|uniref:hypothetical protein n=1 Tax=Georgenia wangjunii TaxID=3117730 RepID=UPI002F261D1A
MWSMLCVVAGAALVGFVLWCRAGRSQGARWWAGRGDGATLDERAVLFFLPAVGLFLVALGPLLAYDAYDPGTRWTLAFVPLVLLGAVLGLWGGLQLNVPTWYLPRWLRGRRTTGRQR